jgi:hypothetical protein
VTNPARINGRCWNRLARRPADHQPGASARRINSGATAGTSQPPGDALSPVAAHSPIGALQTGPRSATTGTVDLPRRPNVPPASGCWSTHWDTMVTQGSKEVAAAANRNPAATSESGLP